MKELVKRLAGELGVDLERDGKINVLKKENGTRTYASDLGIALHLYGLKYCGQIVRLVRGEAMKRALPVGSSFVDHLLGINTSTLEVYQEYEKGIWKPNPMDEWGRPPAIL